MIIIAVATLIVSCGLRRYDKVDGSKNANAIVLNYIDDIIGLSRHVRHLRDNSDTTVVTTRYGGWQIDSIAVYE